MMWTERTVTRAGVRLTCRDWNSHHPSSAPPVVLLHGLAGHAGEWDAAAAHLAPHHRVVAVDQRGHGASERRPADVSRAAYVADVRAVCEQLGVHRPVLVGQSLGGHTAMLTAAAHPDLVRGLVLVEAGAARADPGTPDEIGGWLGSWPLPFPTLAEARTFLTGQGLNGDAWAAGLEQRAEGWYPRFERSVMVAAITENSTRDWWPQWRAVRCPTLLVIGEKGIVPPEESIRMLESADPADPADPSTLTTAVSVPGSGHDVHLDRPAVLHALLSAFLTEFRPEFRQPGGRSDPRSATSFTRT
ncbi:alpha/beta fold hydrolase [Streptomyces sp. AP-93]|uniref:alpha/beta fold hydrolase n=1 Tax=Streptomyces sp. AP-93 TaxID=2929048 RepID=UPI001FB01744|nr:alpha/beta hydrolase [Streptomyces sp. AP-93]MCJ0871712.1 alpha/beta hydrolase [Streptomyces sp. AP-93]